MGVQWLIAFEGQIVVLNPVGGGALRAEAGLFQLTHHGDSE
jgi:hypothetical protein